jgi:hypothetical protein
LVICCTSAAEGKVITEAVGIERNVDGLNAFPFSGKGERREDDFGRGRGWVGDSQPALGSVEEGWEVSETEEIVEMVEVVKMVDMWVVCRMEF